MTTFKILTGLFLSFTVSFFANAITVHLDCKIPVTGAMPGTGAFDAPKVGDEVAFEIDIDMEKQTGTVGGWSTNLYSANPSDPQFTLGITNDSVKFGTEGRGLYLLINRHNLSVVYVLFNNEPFFVANGQGACKKLEKRTPPSGF